MNKEIVFVDRKNTDCNKWDNLEATFGEANLQAMWIADMDFKAASCITKALEKYLDLGVFGYYKVPVSYQKAFMKWEQKYHNYKVKQEWLRFAPGVVPAINWFVQIMTKPQDGIMVQTPIYYPFMDAVKNNGRKLVCSDLVNTKGVYTIDFDKFEKDITDNNVQLFILCSPHNPSGRVWKKAELSKMFEICCKHNVFIISDEIHQDIVFEGSSHIPSATIGDYDHMIVTITSATKTFNLAGLQNSFVIIPDEEIRKKYDTFMENIRIRGGNPFGYIAVEAAYTNGRPWLEKVKYIIYSNYLYAKEALERSLPKVIVTPLEGTYLMWVDFGEYIKADEIKDFIQKKCGLAFDYGDWFGGECFGTHVRINLATSRALVEKAVENIVKQLA